MAKNLAIAGLAVLFVVLQATVGHAEEAARIPLSSAEIEAYQSIASGNIEHLNAGAMDFDDIIISALVALGILFLVLIIV